MKRAWIVAFLLPAPAFAGDGKLFVDRAKVPPGSAIAIRGFGLAPGEECAIRIEGAPELRRTVQAMYSESVVDARFDAEKGFVVKKRRYAPRPNPYGVLDERDFVFVPEDARPGVRRG